MSMTKRFKPARENPTGIKDVPFNANVGELCLC